LNARRLLADSQGQQKKLEKDLREQIAMLPELKKSLEADYKAARDAARTAETFSSWCEEQITQAAVAWLLSSVFLRFCEDNRLIPAPLLAGPGEGNRQARDAAREYFSAHPTENERHYLEHCFNVLGQYPAVAGLYDAAHNPVFRMPLSYDAAKVLVEFWQRVDPDSGALVHDFTDPEMNTRFLGDLYQDLSESARKRYALLQTPEFVEEFILERTLEPAIQTFGIEAVRMIDPTCGSGHFLLGSFHRPLSHWEKTAPGLDIRERVMRALGAVHGVDLNPFAGAIARFRLLVAALKATDIKTLKEAPGWKFNIAAGDSLLHGRRFGELDLGGDDLEQRFAHFYAAEDRAEIERILGQQYHAVVGNPPYITVKDRALNQLYRQKYQSCHMKYSLGVPFTERFFQLSLSASNHPAGYVGLIVTNSFMKREFGKKLIEEYLPRQDLTHVIDTSGAYIPGHGTPTVILFARHRQPIGETVRAVLGIRGEPSTPSDAAQGQVWISILDLVDSRSNQNGFVSAADIPRVRLGIHPWSMQGGVAPTVLQAIADRATQYLQDHATGIGVGALTGEDDVFVVPRSVYQRGFAKLTPKSFVEGDTIRDWGVGETQSALYPLDLTNIEGIPNFYRHAWKFRTTLGTNLYFGETKGQRGIRWFDFTYWSAKKLTGASIGFAFVATHNHFVLDRGGKVFNRTAPVIKLTNSSDEEVHLGLLGLLNSSIACFWMKQTFQNRGSTIDAKGARQTTVDFENFYEFTGTGLQRFPLAEERPVAIGRALDQLAQQRAATLPSALSNRLPLSRDELDAVHERADLLLRQLIAWQEELDWWCYRAYGLSEDDLTYQGTPPELKLGERAFEIVLARKVAAGETETTWFLRHGSTPITDIPAHWPTDYRALMERRMALIESSSWIQLLEKPEYKRRWNQPPWQELEQAALKNWLLNRLETPHFWPQPQLRSVDELAAAAERDADFMAVARLYTGQAGFDVRAMVINLVNDEAAPALKVLRYKDSGLRKRADWEQTWELQRREDVIDAEVEASLKRHDDESDELWHLRLKQEQDRRKIAEVGDIPAPPKYASADYLSTTIWRLRGALDVPKERFFSLPDGDRPGDSLYGWAGWSPAERVRAIAGTYSDASTRKGWAVPQLVPLLVAIQEELPWVLQWHNEVDPEFGVRLGDFFREQLSRDLHTHGLTREDLANWRPEAAGRGRRRRAQA